MNRSSGPHWPFVVSPIPLVLLIFGSLTHAMSQQLHSPQSSAGRSKAQDSSALGTACLVCHRDLTEHYALTAHALTSQPATQQTILGPLRDGRNILREVIPGQPGLFFEIGHDEKGFYQSSVSGVPGTRQAHREPIDEVIGSGIRGQTYLYWHGDQLYELPVTYWRDGNRWINSPGYPDYSADFWRPVTGRCLECHASAVRAKTSDNTSNRFDRSSLVHGIGCMRCHGDGAMHVSAQRSAARPASAKLHKRDSILNPARFSRDRQVELCALCHGGQRDEVAPAFSYTPGAPLDRFLEELPSTLSVSPDVHGDQVGLLSRSQCYQKSPLMTCSTCHDVHQQEKEASTYSDRCLSCHTVETCGLYPKLGHRIASDCIGCHMPIQSTNKIVSRTAGETIQPTIRTHWIAIYPTLKLN